MRLDESNAFNEFKRYEETLQAYDQAIRLDPNYAVAYYNKSLALERLEKSKEAQQAHKKDQQLGFNS